MHGCDCVLKGERWKFLPTNQVSVAFVKHAFKKQKVVRHTYTHTHPYTPLCHTESKSRGPGKPRGGAGTAGPGDLCAEGGVGQGETKFHLLCDFFYSLYRACRSFAEGGVEQGGYAADGGLYS